MSTVTVITDSVACLPREKVREYNIKVVPCLITIEENIPMKWIFRPMTSGKDSEL